MCEIADDLHEQKLFGFADQLRRATLSISNNIAEGSGSEYPKDFQNFLNHARRSTFECASMVMFFHRKELISHEQKTALCNELSQLSRMILSFKRSIN